MQEPCRCQYCGVSIEKINFKSYKSLDFYKIIDLGPNLTPTMQTFLTLNNLKESIIQHICSNPQCIQCCLKNLYHYSSNKNSIISFKSFQNIIEQLSNSISAEDPISLILKLIHGNSKLKCNPRCSLHNIFPLFRKEQSCSCGVFFGAIANDTSFYVEVPLSNILRPICSAYNQFLLPHYCCITNLIELSTLKKLKFLFSSTLKNALIKKEVEFFKCPEVPSCITTKLTVIPDIEDPSLLIIKFNWTSIEDNSFNAAQTLIWLKSKTEFSEFSNCPQSSNLSLKTIYFTKNSKGKVITFSNNTWFKLSSKRNYEIYKGNWFDVIIFSLLKKYIPRYAFYEKSNTTPQTNLANFEKTFIELLSYKILIGENIENFISKIYVMADRIIYSDLSTHCNGCCNTRTAGEECPVCCYLGGDWICFKCQESNEYLSMICKNCHGDRINVSWNHDCEKCGKVSINVNYCKYCPKSECSICSKELFSRELVFCINGNKSSTPNDCNGLGHSFLCLDCKKFTQY